MSGDFQTNQMENAKTCDLITKQNKTKKEVVVLGTFIKYSRKLEGFFPPRNDWFHSLTG